ncbi:unnamed protein product, partial [Ectocarpus sp. 12 AP-2014]
SSSNGRRQPAGPQHGSVNSAHSTGSNDAKRAPFGSNNRGSFGSNRSAGSAGSSGEAPLPPGWSESKTAGGDIFYVNHKDKKTTWVRPKGVPQISVAEAHPPQPVVATPVGREESISFAPAYSSSGSAASGGLGGEQPLPAGWTSKTMPTGEVYYVNHVDKTTSWERPTVPAAAAAAASNTHGVPFVTAQVVPAGYSGSSGLSVGPIGGAAVASAVAAGGEGPLPPGWSVKTTSSGAVYYENHVTKTTSWERPAAPAPAPAPAARAAPQREAPLPSGWSAKTTATGTVYYENHVTKITSWERPTAPAAPVAHASSPPPLPPG